MSRRLAIWLGAIALALVALGLFAWRPTPVVGVDGASLGYSVATSVDSIPCRSGGDSWRCQIWVSGGSSTVDYLVEVDWAGCWDAERVDQRGGYGGTPQQQNGCVSLLDHLRLWDLI